MNVKKSNWLFLIVIILYIGLSNLLSLTGAFELMPETLATLMPELMIIVPALCFVLLQKEPINQTLGFHRIRFSNLLLLIVYVLLLYPLITFANAISMIFVENVVVESSGQFYEMGFLKSFLLVAVVPPLCEETVFRGAIYGGYRKGNTSIAAIVMSSLLFGLLHMNFNQAPYAFLIGVAICLAYEATGSILAGMFIHLLINGFSVVSMFSLDALDSEALTQAEEILGAESYDMQQAYASYAGIFLLIAVVTVPLAICLLHYIAKRSGRENAIKNIWHNRKENRKQIITLPLVIALIINIGYIMLLTFAPFFG